MSKRGKSAHVAAASALLIALVTPASAAAQASQSSSIDEARQSARVHFGPLFAKPSIQLVDLGIDSNVFNGYGDNQQSDFTGTLVPKADVWLRVGKRALLQVTPAADLVWYEKYETERSIDPRVAMRGEIYLQRITLFGEGGYINTRQRPNQEIDVRARHVDKSATAGIDVSVTPELSVVVAAHQLGTRYDAAAEYDNTKLQRTLNRDTEGVELKVRYRVTSLTSLAVRSDLLRDTFKMSPERNSESIRVMPGVEFKPRALITGSAYAGYREFRPADASALPEFKGLVAQLGLSYTLLGSTVFGVSYSRDLTYSYDELQPFFVDDSVGASMRRAIGRRFDALVSADRHSYQYKDLLTAVRPPVPSAPRIDVTWTYAASLGYRVGREGRIAFGASYWRRDSTTIAFRNYENLRFGSNVSLGF
jgi:Putative beta-barrel porin 2